MSPELIGFIIGIGFVVPTIYFVHARGFGDVAWPLFLVTLPIYYMLFGLLALDVTAIVNELLYGIPFVLIGGIAWKLKSRWMLAVLAVGWFGHGFYDYYHDLLFINPGVFRWYPVFCAVVDIAVGCYLLLLAFRPDLQKVKAS